MKKQNFLMAGVMILIFTTGAAISAKAQTDQEFFFDNGQEKVLELKGLELFKGIDITDTYRVGTLFAGEIFYNDYKIGSWSVTLSHKGTENIELCGGANDIITIKLVLDFSWGDKLVLGMIDRSGTPDVFWDFNYAGPACGLGGVGCTCSPETARVDCGADGDPSDLAEVGSILLHQKWGSTFSITAAELIDGQLCHQYPVIPRVYAKLVLTF
jgi:hypothetical protein